MLIIQKTKFVMYSSRQFWFRLLIAMFPVSLLGGVVNFFVRGIETQYEVAHAN